MLASAVQLQNGVSRMTVSCRSDAPEAVFRSIASSARVWCRLNVAFADRFNMYIPLRIDGVSATTGLRLPFEDGVAWSLEYLTYDFYSAFPATEGDVVLSGVGGAVIGITIPHMLEKQATQPYVRVATRDDEPVVYQQMVMDTDMDVDVLVFASRSRHIYTLNDKLFCPAQRGFRTNIVAIEDDESGRNLRALRAFP